MKYPICQLILLVMKYLRRIVWLCKKSDNRPTAVIPAGRDLVANPRRYWSDSGRHRNGSLGVFNGPRANLPIRNERPPAI